MKARSMEYSEMTLLDASSDLHPTKDGYLLARPRIARTGVQLYRGAELGRPDLKEVRVYRSESEVMSRDSVMSLAGKPVTVEHPDSPVNAQNWKDYAVGHVGDEILRDGEFIRVPLHLMDAAAIKEVRSGRSQLSVGYTASLEWGDGVTDKGEAYDVKQISIRANHVALTHTARGGDKLRMGDRRPHQQEKTMRSILVDGISIEMEDKDSQLVERRFTALQKEVTDAQTALATVKTQGQNELATAKTETANATALVQTKDAEIITLKKQLTDATVTADKLDALADARAAVKARAKTLLDSVVLDKKSDADIRRQVVNAHMGDAAKDWNDDMIAASFNTLAVKVADSDGNGSGLSTVVQVLQNGEGFGGDGRTKAYATYDKELTERWKTAGHRVAS